MRIVQLLLFGILFSNTVPTNAKGISPLAIYGQDNIKELYEVKDPMKLQLSRASVALVDNMRIEPTGLGYWRTKGENFQQHHNMCSTERFLKQSKVAYCSGSLIGPDTILTAGHCVENMKDCESTKIVFGMQYHQDGQSLDMIPNEQVYSCKSILHWANQDTGGLDYAVIQLDRRVDGVEPVKLRTEGVIKKQDEIWMIGYPLGLPGKIVDQAKVRSVEKHTFHTNLDAFYNNSGSPVFNSTTGLLEGILIEGEEDFVMHGKCTTFKHCKDSGCTGEMVMKASSILTCINEGC